MSKSKKQTERATQQSSNTKPSFGIILLIAILGGIAVFAFTRNKQYEPSEPTTEAPVQAQQPEQQQYSPPPASETTHEQNPETSAAPEQSGFRVPPFFENPDAAEPLQPILASTNIPQFAREGYEVARRKPKLMTQLPCFCYCDKFGHTSLHTCFETDHAVHCDICLKEALEADRMDSEGMSPQEIREVIIQQYKPRGQHSHS